MKGTLIARYIVSIAVVGALVLGATFYFGEYQYQQVKGDTAVVNIAGRQRMLSQRISKIVAQLQMTEQDVQTKALREELSYSVSAWEKAHQELTKGNTEMLEHLGELNDEQQKLVQEIKENHRRIMGVVETIKKTSEVKGNM